MFSNSDLSPQHIVTNKKNILVTGANGQLGMELQAIAPLHPQYNFLFTTREKLPIENIDAVKEFFSKQQLDFCINCAACTAVDKAETEKENAFLINGTAVGELASVCKTNHTQLIHISTDYVFDGEACTPYKETDPTSPLSVYGESKLKGEHLAFQNDPSTIIIRTSWLYSSYGNNFVKTMLRLMKEREIINVVSDQFGSPTYAADLAEAIMMLIEKCSMSNVQCSILNYANTGKISWYDFALAIKELSGSSCSVNPISTSEYPTAAKRPQYSVFDTRTIRKILNITIPDWKVSLEKCLSNLKNGE